MQNMIEMAILGMLSLLSPALIDIIRRGVQDLVDAAGKTPNKYDDQAAGFLQQLVGKVQ